MKSNAPFLALVTGALTLACALPTTARAQAKPLTQDELLRQIESLSPAATDPGRSVPNRTAKPGTNVGSSDALFPDKLDKKKDKAAKPEKKAKGPTEIVALEATFDQKAHIAVFIGEVVVKDPEFTVQADKLTAYLKHEGKTGEGEGAPKAASAEPAQPNAKKSKGGGLDRAIAEAEPGKIVTVMQEKEEIDGSISRSIGHGRKVHYDSTTGDITLYGKPDVQQGFNTCVATEDGTIMILNRDGKMRVTGAHKTVIAEKLDK